MNNTIENARDYCESEAIKPSAYKDVWYPISPEELVAYASAVQEKEEPTEKEKSMRIIEAIADLEVIPSIKIILDALISLKGVMPFHDGDFTEGESQAMLKCDKAIEIIQSFLLNSKDSKEGGKE